MLSYLKSFRFKLSDLFLFIFAILGILIVLEQRRLLSIANPLELSLPYWIFILYFVIMLASLGFYLYLERGSFTTKYKLIVILLFSFITISQIITILTTANYIEMFTCDITGNCYNSITLFNIETKSIHLFSTIFIIAVIFIGLFIFPKRVKHYEFLSLLCYLLYLAALVIFIISLVKDNYAGFFEKLIFESTLGLEWGIPGTMSIYDLAPVGIFGNKNTYGLFLEVCVCCSLMNYHVTHKKFNIALTFIFYFHLLITLCKTGIIFTSIVIILYSMWSFIYSFKSKNKFNKYVSLGILIFVVLLALTLLITFLVSESLREKFSYLLGDKTTTHRKAIWYFIIQIINKTSIVFGAGYGTYESILINVNAPLSINDQIIATSHNWVYALLGKGGLIALLPYIYLLLFSAYIYIKLFKDYKEHRELIASILFTQMIVFLHSFLEDTINMVIGASVLLLVFKNIIEVNKKSAD